MQKLGRFLGVNTLYALLACFVIQAFWLALFGHDFPFPKGIWFFPAQIVTGGLISNALDARRRKKLPTNEHSQLAG